jgi:hypothetical protein
MYKSSIEVYIDDTISECEPELKYIIEVFSFNENFSIDYVKVKNIKTIVITDNIEGDIIINKQIFANTVDFKFKNNCNNEGYVLNVKGEIDFLGTAFYLLTCAQELDKSKVDKFGRFPYAESIQKQLGNIEKNIVQNCFDRLVENVTKLKHVFTNKTRSKIFVSHDVDTVNGALMQDGFYALKKFDIASMFKIMFANVLQNPQWLNMDLIMKIESEYDFKSTFYWLVNKGLSPDGVKNSDYNIHSKSVRKCIESVTQKGWENGLHKSDSDDNFQEEISKLQLEVVGNRYHFLKFHPHINFRKLEASNLKFDSSLGFAEEVGFRNNYGLPYRPFDFENRRAFNFIECPLMIMDTTLHGYQKINADEAFKKIISFVDTNSENCVLSMLWHNNYFTDFKYGSYYKLYKKLLAYFVENKFDCITQQQIIDKYLL